MKQQQKQSWRIIVSFLAGGILVLTCASTWAQSYGWSEVSRLSSTGQMSEKPQIALSSDGTKATAVWRYRHNGFNWAIDSASLLLAPDNCDFRLMPAVNGKAVIFCL